MYIEKLIAKVDDSKEKIFETADYIWANPETGYKEWKTHGHMLKRFQELGYEPVLAGNIPGFYTDIDTGKPGPCILIMAELDSIICPTHPDADPKTGAVHACGHHAQCASMVGIASALKDNIVKEYLSGKIRLMLVPAEELIEIEYRNELKDKEIIKYLGGKIEFMHRGYMDNVDIALMLHTSRGKGKFYLNPGSNGLIAKSITFTGRSAHAGGSPQKGINALYAANTALNAINSLRETFDDSDHIRVHPVITGRVCAVNAIPECITMESFVRGANIEAIKAANMKVNRALASGAVALGAHIHIKDCPGYMPVFNDANVYIFAKKAAEEVYGSENVEETAQWDTASTDMGDISCVIPAIHPHGSGAEGISHGSDYKVADPESAYIQSAKYLVTMACRLLENSGAEAKKIIESKSLKFNSMKEYFEMADSLTMDKDIISYKENGNIVLSFNE